MPPRWSSTRPLLSSRCRLSCSVRMSVPCLDYFGIFLVGWCWKDARAFCFNAWNWLISLNHSVVVTNDGLKLTPLSQVDHWNHEVQLVAFSGALWAGHAHFMHCNAVYARVSCALNLVRLVVQQGCSSRVNFDFGKLGPLNTNKKPATVESMILQSISTSVWFEAHRFSCERFSYDMRFQRFGFQRVGGKRHELTPTLNQDTFCRTVAIFLSTLIYFGCLILGAPAY